jgi:hypothetical protein
MVTLLVRGEAASRRCVPSVSRDLGVTFVNQLSAGAARGIRTPDPIITNDVLYQLSYCGPLE